MEEQSGKENSQGISKAIALKFVILLGIVSLFADMTYEGAYDYESGELFFE